MTSLKLRILFDGAMVGPGKAELLERIGATGSIAAAGRQMQMSYKRAWMLVEEMNAAFTLPLVVSARGGPGGGGAQLTETGQQVLALYREVVRLSEAASASPLSVLQDMLRLPPDSERSSGK